MLPALQASIIMDSEQLHADIITNVASDPLAQKHLTNSSDLRWMHTDNGFLRLNGWIYVPKANNLWLQVLQYKHNHILSGHFGQNKTMSLVCREYIWPNLQTFIIDLCKSCTSCMHSKSQHHKPYSFLKQLLDSLGYTVILVIDCRLLKQGIFLTTQSPQLPLLSYLFYMSSPNMVYLLTSPLTKAPNLSHTSSSPSVNH